MLVGAVVTACGSSDEESGGAANAGDNAIAEKFDVKIPSASVRFGMQPFGDHMIYAAGIANGWFKDVGISIPGGYPTVAFEQTLPLLNKGDFDLTTMWAPFMAQNSASSADVKEFAFGDTHDGVWILAPPKTKYKTLKGEVEAGTSFDDAMKTVVGQFRGKKLAIDDTGSHRTFIDGILSMGGITAKDLGELLTVDDGRMLVLGRGGQIDFAKPLGGAQEAELEADGWYPVISAKDLIEALPPGDPRGVSAIGNTGLITTQKYYEANKDTILRFVSVMYRCVDAVESDVKDGKDSKALGKILPVLKSAAGVELTPESLETLYGRR